ncbi:MAG: YggT family protein [Rhodospirillales bacterium]|nr:YggT family protein [Rhodospirillales bacterium]
MDVILGPLLWLIITVIDLYTWVVIAGVVMSWLTAFSVINTQNRVVYLIGDVVYRLTEPALRPIRKFLPDLGGIDLSPVVLLLGVIFLKQIVIRLAYQIGG